MDSNTLNTSQTKLGTLHDGPAQLEWLERPLDASNARWKMVIMHHPMHSPSVPIKTFLFIPYAEGRAREIQLEQQLAPILSKHGVDVVFAGHNHFYARMAPQDGIRYFVSGGGGRSVYDPRASKATWPRAAATTTSSTCASRATASSTTPSTATAGRATPDASPRARRWTPRSRPAPHRPASP